jgi:type IV secretion system protein VirB8
MFTKKKNSVVELPTAVDQAETPTKAIKHSVDFEITLTEQRRKSEFRAWTVALVAVIACVCLLIALIVMLPLKEKVPYLVMADPYTGTSSLSKLTENVAPDVITQNEAINKSNVAHFIIARESYDWDLIGRRDWITVNSMATSGVLEAYRQEFDENNKLNPDKIYARAKTVRVKVKTIVLIKDERQKYTGATVRFDKIVLNKATESLESGEAFIATMAFSYRDNLKMDENQRVENPLGFRVVSYRVDPEASGGKGVIMKEVSEQAAKAAQ